MNGPAWPKKQLTIPAWIFVIASSEQAQGRLEQQRIDECSKSMTNFVAEELQMATRDFGQGWFVGTPSDFQKFDTNIAKGNNDICIVPTEIGKFDFIEDRFLLQCVGLGDLGETNVVDPVKDKDKDKAKDTDDGCDETIEQIVVNAKVRSLRSEWKSNVVANRARLQESVYILKAVGSNAGFAAEVKVAKERASYGLSFLSEEMAFDDGEKQMFGKRFLKNPFQTLHGAQMWWYSHAKS